MVGLLGLTVHVEPPLVLEGGVRDGGVLGPAGQVLAIVIDRRHEGQHAQGLIIGLGELKHKKIQIKLYI